MTNYEKWQLYTQHLFSPQTYIDYGWRFIVGAALQRRVWFGNIEGDPLFPNPYIVFVGDAGVGKGLVLGKANELLKHHRKDQTSVDGLNRPKYLFTPGPDDLTYEKLCEKLSLSTTSHKKPDGKLYVHASMAFVLEELKTLFKRRHDDSLNTLFLKVYDCKDHDYETRNRGEHRVRKPCMALLAGCTPDFLPKGIAQGILEDGTVSRMIFVYEWEPRFSSFFLKQPGDAELRAKNDLLKHIHQLSALYGEVTLAPGLHEYLENWFDTEWKAKVRRCHPKMKTYYARSRVHVLKLSMAVHFSDSFDMVLTEADVATAIKMLDAIEPHMTLALSSAGRNENNKLAKDIESFIRTSPTGEVALADLLSQYQTEVTFDSLRTILEDLRIMGRLHENEGRYSVK